MFVRYLAGVAGLLLVVAPIGAASNAWVSNCDRIGSARSPGWRRSSSGWP